MLLGFLSGLSVCAMKDRQMKDGDKQKYENLKKLTTGTYGKEVRQRNVDEKKQVRTRKTAFYKKK